MLSLFVWHEDSIEQKEMNKIKITDFFIFLLIFSIIKVFYYIIYFCNCELKF
jgi:hypothetical protein